MFRKIYVININIVFVSQSCGVVTLSTLSTRGDHDVTVASTKDAIFDHTTPGCLPPPARCPQLSGRLLQTVRQPQRLPVLPQRRLYRHPGRRDPLRHSAGVAAVQRHIRRARVAQLLRRALAEPRRKQHSPPGERRVPRVRQSARAQPDRQRHLAVVVGPLRWSRASAAVVPEQKRTDVARIQPVLSVSLQPTNPRLVRKPNRDFGPECVN